MFLSGVDWEEDKQLAIKTWDGGWEERPVRVLADLISGSSRRLGAEWGRDTEYWDGGDDEHCLRLLLSLLGRGRVLKLPAFWFKKVRSL